MPSTEQKTTAGERLVENNSDIAVQEHDIAVAGHRTRFWRAGSGTPLVLIHGLLGYSFSWRFNVPVLARHFTVFAPDLLGMGYSDRATGIDCSMRATAQRVLTFCDALGLDRFDLVGTSHGGALAAIVATQITHHRVRRLALVAPVNPWSKAGRRRTRVLATPLGAYMFRLAWSRIWRSRGYFLRRLYGDPARMAPGTLEGYGAPLRIAGTVDHLLGVIRSWHADLCSLDSVYRQLLDTPTLLIWGDRDAAVLPESAVPMQRAIAGAELVVLPGIGHLPYEEAPEDFNRILLQFLLRP